MKKDLLIGLLVILTLTSLTFGIYQKVRADRNALKANEQEMRVKELITEIEEQAKQLEQQAKLAEQAMSEAMKARQVADESSAGK